MQEGHKRIFCLFICIGVIVSGIVAIVNEGEIRRRAFASYLILSEESEAASFSTTFTMHEGRTYCFQFICIAGASSASNLTILLNDRVIHTITPSLVFLRYGYEMSDMYVFASPETGVCYITLHTDHVRNWVLYVYKDLPWGTFVFFTWGYLVVMICVSVVAGLYLVYQISSIMGTKKRIGIKS